LLPHFLLLKRWQPTGHPFCQHCIPLFI
jgi:hypothetical protein